MLQAVITTIQHPTSSVIRLTEFLAANDAGLVIAGDTKGPDAFDLSSVEAFDSGRLTFLSIADQLASGFSIVDSLPTKHYCRKNVGYLEAIRSGASCIYETDDDNAPLDHWTPRGQWIKTPRFAENATVDNRPTWVNVYKFFSTDLIWPRGLPLDQIREPSAITAVPNQSLAHSAGETGEFWAPIQQGLADGAPDVDAAWRLILDREFVFDCHESVMLAPGQWCPFNTQTTWWWPAVYPLLYVPSYCSFRMCDIWKSFVAQRCLWELGTGVVFHASEVVQERNPHNLMRDFEDEIPGYLQNHELACVLESIDLVSGVADVGTNLRTCYAALVSKGIFPEKELLLVDTWLADVQAALLQSTPQA
ncbi:STELLO glycosyltransferase family protein [Stieleria sp. ICT_E10.1]|uniref:STELLO glycosyltransferase family protein n=1 Tax=Stieleria sedimenti TaxID=2976331 RepID=UPI0021801ABD|nr:STELLO glycosyltransferase family protein [Stieleria sedimenti]MCS7469428.1 STELLO glycosyltransferase family protein [Stieleria sedimenti]